MVFKGNKGPWKVVNINSKKGFPSVIFYGTEKQYEESWGRTGVTINASGTQEEQDANALLISCAPELLEMLQLGCMDAEERGRAYGDWYTMAKQLIKKATEV